jgi:hypothetical protein
MKSLLISVFLLFVASSPCLAAGKNKVPEGVAQALRTPGKIVLYSLEPVEHPLADDRAFHGFKVVGQVDIDPKEAAKAIASFQPTIAPWSGQFPRNVINPRHGLRVKSGGHMFDFVLCQECGQLLIFEGEQELAYLHAEGSSQVLDDLLKSSNAFVANPAYSAAELKQIGDDPAAQAKKDEEIDARWLAAMPKTIRPLWANAVNADFGRPDSIQFRAALAKEAPNAAGRIAALFTWYGSGAGSWSRYPGYEQVAENLLLDFSTKDLVAAAQKPKLTDEQLEGAARFFSRFSFYRPDEVKSFPASLKKTLMEHMQKSTEKDNLYQAKEAFDQS